MTDNKNDSIELIMPFDRCFMCGKGGCTRHHVIPKAFNPKMNVIIPLCMEHKDVTHPVVKTFYFPKHLRNKIGKAFKHSKDVYDIIASIRNDLNFVKTNKVPRLSLPDKDKTKA